jgi:hypothetical protein
VRWAFLSFFVSFEAFLFFLFPLEAIILWGGWCELLVGFFFFFFFLLWIMDPFLGSFTFFLLFLYTMLPFPLSFFSGDWMRDYYTLLALKTLA